MVALLDLGTGGIPGGCRELHPSAKPLGFKNGGLDIQLNKAAGDPYTSVIPETAVLMEKRGVAVLHRSGQSDACASRCQILPGDLADPNPAVDDGCTHPDLGG